MTKQSTKSRAAKTKTTKSKTTAAKRKNAAVKTTKAKTTSAPVAIARKQITVSGLRKLNMFAAVVLAAQAVAIFVMAKAVSLPVTTSYLTVDELASRNTDKDVLAQATKPIFDLNLTYLVVAFLLLAAIALGAVATLARKRYEEGVEKGTNIFRWLEFSVTASLMLVSIGLLSGISDLTTLIAICVFVLIANTVGYGMELMNQAKNKPGIIQYKAAGLAIVTPWLAFFIYAFGTKVYGSGFPSFLYWIYISMVILLGLFVYTKHSYFKQKGKWANYPYSEKMHIVLSLVIYSALAWQIFAGALR